MARDDLGREPVPVALAGSERRRLVTMRWGLPAEAFVDPVVARQRNVIYSRDLAPQGSRLRVPGNFARCLIVIEAAGYPMGPSGTRTRGWSGL